MRLASLTEEEKAALRSLREEANTHVQRLLGEAFALQTSRKRKREDSCLRDGMESNTSDEEGEGEDSSEIDRAAKKQRSMPRQDGIGVPTLTKKEVGQVMCQAIL